MFVRGKLERRHLGRRGRSAHGDGRSRRQGCRVLRLDGKSHLSPRSRWQYHVPSVPERPERVRLRVAPLGRHNPARVHDVPWLRRKRQSNFRDAPGWERHIPDVRPGRVPDPAKGLPREPFQVRPRFTRVLDQQQRRRRECDAVPE